MPLTYIRIIDVDSEICENSILVLVGPAGDVLCPRVISEDEQIDTSSLSPSPAWEVVGRVEGGRLPYNNARTRL